MKLLSIWIVTLVLMGCSHEEKGAEPQSTYGNFPTDKADLLVGKYYIDHDNCTLYKDHKTMTFQTSRRSGWHGVKIHYDDNTYDWSFLEYGKFEEDYPSESPAYYDNMKDETWYDKFPEDVSVESRDLRRIEKNVFHESSMTWAVRNHQDGSHEFVGYREFRSSRYFINEDGSVDIDYAYRRGSKEAVIGSCRLLRHNPKEVSDAHLRLKAKWEGVHAIQQDKCDMFGDHREVRIVVSEDRKFNQIKVVAMGGQTAPKTRSFVEFDLGKSDEVYDGLQDVTLEEIQDELWFKVLKEEPWMGKVRTNTDFLTVRTEDRLKFARVTSWFLEKDEERVHYAYKNYQEKSLSVYPDGDRVKLVQIQKDADDLVLKSCVLRRRMKNSE